MNVPPRHDREVVIYTDLTGALGKEIATHWSTDPLLADLVLPGQVFDGGRHH
jgi:hypothetical protein